MPHNGSGSLAAIQDFLNDSDDSRLPRHIAAFSFRPRTLPEEPYSSRLLSISNTGTSMLLSSADRTRGGTNPSHDLPALSRETSSRSSADSRQTPDTLDQVIPDHMLLGQGADGVLEAPAPAILQCPFNFLQCFLTFAAFGQWLSHSLMHFRQQTPPARIKCCFCPCQFDNPDGRVCWRQLLEHVELHHRQGETLAYVPPNLSLIEYLRNEALITDAEYRFLKTRAGRPSGPFGQGSTEDSAYDLQNAPMYAASVVNNSQRRERRRERR